MAQRLLSLVASSLRGVQGIKSALVTELTFGSSAACATSSSGSVQSQSCLRDACSAAMMPAQVGLNMHSVLPCLCTAS